MKQSEFFVPAGFGQAELTEKKSTFIGQVWQVETEGEAKELVSQTKIKYHDARHNCWCYLLHQENTARYSDDGEPQGTAGQPMMEVLTRSGVENVCCVVTRYFGGILLGAGGLVRAYSAAAKMALDEAGLAEVRTWSPIVIQSPYTFYEQIKNTTQQTQGVIESTEFSSNVTALVLIPIEKQDEYVQKLTDLSAGLIKTNVGEPVYRAVPITKEE